VNVPPRALWRAGAELVRPALTSTVIDLQPAAGTAVEAVDMHRVAIREAVGELAPFKGTDLFSPSTTAVASPTNGMENVAD
jgi:hypothetical protein